jgi:hypothetical protein
VERGVALLVLVVHVRPVRERHLANLLVDLRDTTRQTDLSDGAQPGAPAANNARSARR